MDQSPPPRLVISTRQSSSIPGIVTANVTTAAMITPQRIPIRNESFISIPFHHSIIETRLPPGLSFCVISWQADSLRRRGVIIECGRDLCVTDGRGAVLAPCQRPRLQWHSCKRRYNTFELNSPSLTRVRIFILGRTDTTVRITLPRSSVVML